jgi:hypothetical protein
MNIFCYFNARARAYYPSVRLSLATRAEFLMQPENSFKVELFSVAPPPRSARSNRRAV